MKSSVGILTVSIMMFAGIDVAEDVYKGALIVRDGAANTDENYTNEDKDINNKLQNVSALCTDKSTNRNRDNALALISTDGTRTWRDNFGTAQVSTIIDIGGNVVKDPQTDNPNHCLISGLQVGQMKGVWKMCTNSEC